MYYSVVDKDFLKGFVKRKPLPGANGDEDLDSSELTDWKNIKKHITQNSKIYVVAQIDEQTKSLDDNPLYFQLLNDYQNNGSKTIKFVKEISEDIRNEISFSLSPFIFLDASQIGFSPNDFGIALYNSKEILEKWVDKCNIKNEYVLVRSQKEHINNIIFSEDFKRFQHRTKTILITDNYIFSDKRNVNNTLIPLIKNLISNCKRNHFDLIIITASEKFYFSNSYTKIRSTANEIYDYTNLQLKKAFTNINLQLIIKPFTKEDFHDRNLITTYYRFKFSNSLSFMDNEGKIISQNSLTFDSNPHVKNDGNETCGDNTLLIINQVKKVLSNKDVNKINFTANSLFSLA